MATEFLKALFIGRSEVSAELSRLLSPSSGRPVRVFMQLPTFTVNDVLVMLQQLGPEIVILDTQVDGCDLAAIQEIRRSTEQRPFILIGLAPASSTSIDAILPIADLTYTLPLSVSTIDRICQEAPPKYQAIAAGWQKGAWDSSVPESIRAATAAMTGGWQKQCILTYTSKGGVGKSTLAVELAVTLASLGGRTVALVDGNMNGGHIASKLALAAEPNITNAAFSFNAKHLRERLTFDADMTQKIRSIMQPVSGAPSLFVLAGIQNQDQAVDASIKGQAGEDFIVYLLNMLLSQYDFVVVDGGSSINVGVHKGALKRADAILMIANSDLESLGDIKAQIEILAKAAIVADPSKFRLVMNQYLEAAGVSLKQAVDYSGVASIGIIPFCPEIVRCSNQRRSFVASYINQSGNSAPIEEALSGIVNTASHFYKPISAAWAERQKKKGKSGSLFGRK